MGNMIHVALAVLCIRNIAPIASKAAKAVLISGIVITMIYDCRHLCMHIIWAGLLRYLNKEHFDSAKKKRKINVLYNT